MSRRVQLRSQALLHALDELQGDFCDRRSLRLGVPDTAMLFAKKPRQQRVDPEQSFARERHALAGPFGQVALALKVLPDAGKSIDDIDPELLREIARANRAALQLQDHLADQPLLRGRPV